LPLRRPCPGVVTVHDLAFEEHRSDFSRRTGWKYRTITPRAARSAERVICDSAFTAGDLCARYRVDPAKCRVVALAPALTHGAATPPPGPYILAVGSLRPKKNLARLVEAFSALQQRGLPHRLVIAGADGGEGDHLRAAADGAPVEILGFVPEDGVDALMRGADLLVHPSLYEGFGMVVVEAMQRGCPVALARATALPETGGDAAVYFDPLDVGDIARAIEQVVHDAALRERLTRLGRARAEKLSWRRTAAATIAVYRELM
jgi:glycosyltransferase involved in cell wall biosynthesis